MGVIVSRIDSRFGSHDGDSGRCRSALSAQFSICSWVLLLSEKRMLSVILTRDPRYGHVLAETVPLGPQNTATDGAIALTCVFWQTGHHRTRKLRTWSVLDEILI